MQHNPQLLQSDQVISDKNIQTIDTKHIVASETNTAPTSA
jgi:hypothetical protein